MTSSDTHLALAAAEPPLYAALHLFCVNPRVKTAAVKAAVEAARGESVPARAVHGPYTEQSYFWTLEFRGHHLSVEAWTDNAPMPDGTPLLREGCRIFDKTSDEDAARAIAAWAAVPAVLALGMAPSGNYVFVVKNGIHHPASEDGSSMLQADGCWRLNLGYSSKATGFDLTRERPHAT